jgi:hypothetical protein
MKKLAALLVIGLYVGLMFQFPHLMLNPGEAVKGHQKIKTQCLSCHTPFKGVPNTKCISCHKLSDIGKNSKDTAINALFHESLSGQKCITCHTDHQGINPEHPISGFKHDLVSEKIINRCVSCHVVPNNVLHKQLSNDCKPCHTTNSWEFSRPFDHDLLNVNTKTNCMSCHIKPADETHKQFNQQCSQCHGEDKWIPSTFDHSTSFILDRDHNVKCTICHTGNNFKSYTCYSCHEHSQGEMISEHSEEGIYNIDQCAKCHQSANEDDIKTNSGRKNEGNTKFKENRDGDDD